MPAAARVRSQAWAVWLSRAFLESGATRRRSVANILVVFLRGADIVHRETASWDSPPYPRVRPLRFSLAGFRQRIRRQLCGQQLAPTHPASGVDPPSARG